VEGKYQKLDRYRYYTIAKCSYILQYSGIPTQTRMTNINAIIWNTNHLGLLVTLLSNMYCYSINFH
jgi:hypothetical protein